jgi:transposase InsO family protein
MQNGYVESFNGRVRDECLNVNWFLTPEDAKGKIERWRNEYNTERPHSTAVWPIARRTNMQQCTLNSPAGWPPSHRTARRSR